MKINNQQIVSHQTPHINSLEAERLKLTKAAYTTRRIEKNKIETLLGGTQKPRPGDLVLARVEQLGQHERIELEHGRRAPLFVGDEIMLVYGNRYAPDQFESEIPTDLQRCHMVAAGGIASRFLNRHVNVKTPTEIQPIGLLGDANGRPINIADWKLSPRSLQRPHPFVIAVAGTSMNAGKTTSAAHLIKGMTHSGMKVGAAKITGTGAGGDRWLMQDAGAIEVVDFTDAGFATTYHASIEELEGILTCLTTHLSNLGAEAIVLEIADGLLQQETAMLLNSPHFQRHVDAVIFASDDALGANAGVDWLRTRKLPVVAVSGCVSSSPLASREAANATGLPVFTLKQLSSPDITVDLFEFCGEWLEKTAKVS